MDMLLKTLIANSGKRINLNHFSKLGRGHSAITKKPCCDGKGHEVGRLKNAEDWAE